MEYLENACVLEEFDLSWNNIRPNDFVQIMNALQDNVILRVLNLSWNLMIPQQEQRDKSDYEYPVRKDKFFNREDWEMTTSELLAMRFSKLIRFN